MSARNGFRWRQRPPRGSRIDPTHPMAAGLVNYFLLNEATGGVVRDAASGASTDGSGNVGSSWQPAGADGPYLRTVGTAGYMARQSGVALPQAAPLTVFALARVPTSGNNGSLRPAAGVYDSGASQNFGVGFAGTTGLPTMSANNGGNNFFSGAALGVGVWATLVAVWESTTSRKLYVNGALSASQTSSFAAPTNAMARTFLAPNATSFLDVRAAGVYGRALSAAEVRRFAADPYALVIPPATRRFFVGTAVDPGADPFPAGYGRPTNTLIRM